MRLDIWSDVVCPWCYIGKRRLETALAGFEHRDQVEVVYHAFELDPSAPTEPTETVADMLGRKYGGGADAGRQMIAQVDAVAAQEGLTFRQAEAMHANTFDAHRLLHLALVEGVQSALEEELFSAYFERAENVADHAVLAAAAAEVGLDTDRVRQVLESDEYAEEVRADIATAGRLGATGVPFYVVAEKYGISGAQPAETFAQVLQRAWDESQPAIQMIGPMDGSMNGGAEGDVCGPDGCAS